MTSRKTKPTSKSMVGELSGSLSEELRQQHPEIPWRAVKDTRNFYVNNYGNVDISFVWDTITNDIPGLQHWCDGLFSDDQTDFLTEFARRSMALQGR